MGKEGTEGVNYPADKQGRLEAGFTREEIEITAKPDVAILNPREGNAMRDTPARLP